MSESKSMRRRREAMEGTPTPTLTDAEREAVERGMCALMGVQDMSAECSRWDADAAAMLRGLLERTIGDERETGGT